MKKDFFGFDRLYQINDFLRKRFHSATEGTPERYGQVAVTKWGFKLMDSSKIYAKGKPRCNSQGKPIPNLTSKDCQGDQMKEATLQKRECPCWMEISEIPILCEATFQVKIDPTSNQNNLKSVKQKLEMVETLQKHGIFGGQKGSFA